MKKQGIITARQRVEQALRLERVDRVPFTIYESKIPQCAAERAMRNRGLCIVNRRSVVRTHQPNVKVRQATTWEDGKQMVRTWLETPVGTVTTLTEPAGFTSWTHEKMFKGPDDYKVLRFLLQDEQYEPDYAGFARSEADFGGDAIGRAGFGLEPLQAMISGSLMGMETFCMEWMDRRDEILKLYDILVAKRRLLYPIVAQSPATHANYGGNVVPEIIDVETFKKYYISHYNEAAEVMHKHGKLIGCHFDANCGPIATAIAGTALDYVEAFTPAPDTDMTLAQARAAWPKKALWLNFPSSIHLKPDAAVEQAAVGLLDELDGVEGVIMGITEDMPPDRWQGSCTAIMDGLDRHAKENPKLYTGKM
ncbi:MAG: hypothetical protein ABIF71_12105 [Planctomycetota bacterium]